MKEIETAASAPLGCGVGTTPYKPSFWPEVLSR